MAYDVHAEQAAARPLAAVRATTTPQRLGADIVRLLDMVWPVLREQGVRTGHNVVVYYGGDHGALTIDAGVEALTDFDSRGEVRGVATPAGEVATEAHYGEYSDMAAAYAALEQWRAANGRQPAGVSWEVYGDWDDDPARQRTDVYFLLEPAARSPLCSLTIDPGRSAQMAGQSASGSLTHPPGWLRPAGRAEVRDANTTVEPR